MSIKTRLLLSYIAMTFIPVVLFAVIAGGLYTVLFKNIGEGRGTPAIWEKASLRGEMAAGLKFMIQTEPDRFADPSFVAKADEQLTRLDAGIVVTEDGRITYASDLLRGVDVEKEIQKWQPAMSWHRWGAKGSGRFSVEKFDVAFSGQHTGAVYVLTDMSTFFAEAKKLFPLMMLTLLLVIGLTNGILTYSVSRSLIKPLYALKHAAEQIKDGDLSHEIALKRKDEIGELGEAFEEMRSRLSDSIRLQLQYEDNRKELIASISHDLKTPITGIKACVEGLQDGIADTDAMRDKYMGMIAKKTEDMDRLIEELLLFSKLDLKKLPFHMEPTDLKGYVADCVQELRLDPRMSGVKIACELPDRERVQVMADREKLRRVILNIIDNSLKYLDKADKELSVNLRDGSDEAVIRIKDNGSGIEEAALPHIFDRFYRAEPSRNTDTGGSGLGLAIVKQMIEGMGGRVWAESRTGEGTSIYFALPKMTRDGGERA
uniref:sensor histidine kinase n=1 Tax=Paenibacillus terrae TaxID=159743 RepID=UPI0011A61F44|nr:HAMP domain-containing sensor histidine kinase [Paenibacillus terrae]